MFKWLKKILPPPVNVFNQELQMLRAYIKEQNDEIIKQQKTNYDFMTNIQARQEEYLAKQLELDEKITRVSGMEDEIVKKLNLLFSDSSLLGKQEFIISLIRDHCVEFHDRMSIVIKELSDFLENYSANEGKLQERIDFLVKKQELTGKTLEEKVNKSNTLIRNVREIADSSRKITNENIWAQIFNNTAKSSDWLTDLSFSPGRGAIGYPALYAMFRIFADFKPKCILELGMGQSTKLISQYVGSHEDIEHYVVEHDPEWIEFCSNKSFFDEKTKVICLDIDYVKYKNTENVRIYKNFTNAFHNKKFDLIFIDAPLGTDMKEFSRIDVLQLIPDYLSDDFIIIFDDTHRTGEKATVEEIKSILQENNIEYSIGSYTGENEITLIYTKKYKFLYTI